MPRDKDFKRHVRTRMKKTGEAYTTARARLLQKSTSRSTPGEPAPAPTVQEPPAQEPPDYAAIAGMSDAAIQAKTGCTWERWVYALDRLKADRMTHTEIARLVHEKYAIDGWWAQAVTVGYERIRGLRERGQRRDGRFEASRSRTFDVPVDTLFDAWLDDGSRRAWLAGIEPVVRTASRPRSIRMGLPDGTIVALWFTEKGATKSAVSVQQAKLESREEAAAFRAYWGEQFDALKAFLAG